jgi:hypothetical protein
LQSGPQVIAAASPELHEAALAALNWSFILLVYSALSFHQYWHDHDAP